MPRTSRGPLVPVEPSPGALALWVFRRAAKLTQAEVAHQLGVSGPTVHDWERGRKRPRAGLRAAIEQWSRGQVPAVTWAHVDELQPCSP